MTTRAEQLRDITHQARLNGKESLIQQLYHTLITYAEERAKDGYIRNEKISKCNLGAYQISVFKRMLEDDGFKVEILAAGIQIKWGTKV